MKPVEFNKTTFYKGWNATYGKIPVKLEVYLDFQDDGGFIRLGLFAGMDKMYRVSDIGHFLEALEGLQPYYFSKNFILEPSKMYFEKADKKILEFLNVLRQEAVRTVPFAYRELHTNEVVLDKTESERLLDYIWDDIGSIKFGKHPDKIRFENDINIKITVEKVEECPGTASASKGDIPQRKRNTSCSREVCPLTLIMDYSEYGDFEPVAINFRYIACKDKRLIVKLSEAKRELFINLYPFKNEESIVAFTIGMNEKKLFQKNFIDRYLNELKISMDSAVQKEMTESSLLSRVYFDVALKGIVSKIEFCYADKLINPLDDFEANKSFRELDSEKKVIAELKYFGFREQGRLFLLDDVEKIMSLLTDNLKELKKISEVYYSEDFKKLYVKSLSSLGLSLSEDGSVIHMNINLENVSDEELAELLDAVKTGKKYYRLRNGSIINLSSVESSKFIDLINSLEINKDCIHGNVIKLRQV